MQSIPLIFGKSGLTSSPVLLTALSAPSPEAKVPDHLKGPVWLGILYIFFRPHVLKAAFKYTIAAVVLTHYDSPGTVLLGLLILMRISGAPV